MSRGETGGRMRARRVAMGTMTALAAALFAPTLVRADTPVAKATLYEVTESLRLKGRRNGGDTTSMAQRFAKASLLGTSVEPLVQGNVFSLGTFMESTAFSSVDTATGRGPVMGDFSLLQDLDPTRDSIDTLEVKAKGWVRGDMDLSTAGQGFASISGRWGTHQPRDAGTFRGLFLIPFHLPDNEDQYYYANLGLDGPGTLCGGGTPLCPLSSDEFTLGIPATKLVIVFSK